MKQRILTIPMSDVTFDPKAVSARICHHCGTPPFRIVTGGGVVGGTLVLALEPCPAEVCVPEYVMTKLTPDTALDGVTTAVMQRYASYYSLIVLAEYADETWALVAKPVDGAGDA